MKRIRAVCFGLGVIGGMVAKAIIERKKSIELVGAIDIDPRKVGSDLGKLLALDGGAGVVISNDLDAVIATSDPDVVIHTTSSQLSKVFPEIQAILSRKVSVVSSCEELSFPTVKNRELAQRLDSLAKNAGVAVVGTGINPGFVMDLLPIVMTAPCLEINSITISRRLDAGKRRVPFQKKVGVGMDQKEFESSLTSGKISGHVGLEESASMLAAALGWKLDSVTINTPQPVITGRPIQSGFGQVESGKVIGVTQSANSSMCGRTVITHNFMAFLGAEPEYDEVVIEGVPSFSVRTSPCINGDVGTIAMLINTVPRVLDATPGLHTMKDLPVVSALDSMDYH